MSREININNSIKLIPNAYTNTGSYHFTNQTINNAYSDADSTSSNRMTLARSNNSTRKSEIYYEFDKSSLTNIPSNATITSITVNVKYYVNNTTYVTAVSMQLYSNTTAKGTAVTSRPTSGTKYAITAGTWTREELDNIRLYVSGTHNASTNNGYIYFYGADVTVNYNVSGTAYTITATSNVDDVTVTPATQELISGESATVTINGITNTTDISVTDNGTDVTSQLVEHTVSGGTIEKYPGTQTTSGIQSGSSYAAYAVGRSAENPYSSSNNMYASQNSNGYAEYPFDFSDIPSGVTIDSIEVRCYGHRESSTTSSTYVAKIGLYSGSTLKSTEQEFTSTNNQTITINNPGTWTREELQNAKLRFTVGYYGGLLLGATWIVNYSVESTHYYTYTINNLNADHVIVVDDAVVYVPPEEDPEYNYYPVTISSINATTNPAKGTTRVVEGTNQTITIYPDDPLVTLILDNGVDVSSQLVTISGTQPAYTVTTAPGADYGFNLNSSTGYYVSTNAGISSSASVARVSLSLPVRCMIKFTFINNGEETYDFGVFGKVDTTLSTVGWTASSNSGDITTDAGLEQLRCNTSTYNSTSTQTLNYEVAAGEHYIDVKYGKDQGSDSGNDSLQFKLEIETLDPNNNYTYTLNNINESHSLIFVFGDVTYYYVNSSGSDSKLYPSGQYVVLDGDSYKLVIVPNETNATVTVLDNNVNVTSRLERLTNQVEKDGSTITYVNYIYKLSNISATHNIVVSCASGSTIYVWKNSAWTSVSKVYKWIDNRWQEQTNLSSIFDTNTIYITN